ncbi:MAG: hypothetical protein PWP75_1118, partial [Caldanaerobacter sp.]|nr:hypothetical protein [Caldanaerobacter sp.]
KAIGLKKIFIVPDRYFLFFIFLKRRNLKKYVEINNTGWEIELCKRQKDLGNCTRNR